MFKIGQSIEPIWFVQIFRGMTADHSSLKVRAAALQFSVEDKKCGIVTLAVNAISPCEQDFFGHLITLFIV